MWIGLKENIWTGEDVRTNGTVRTDVKSWMGATVWNGDNGWSKYLKGYNYLDTT